MTTTTQPTRERDTLRAVLATMLKPRERVGVAAWADAYRVLPQGTSQYAGKWDSAMTPYLAGIMEAFSDPATEKVVVMKASQGGGTECLINAMLWCIDVDPGPALVVYPNTEMAEAMNTERITPALLACPQTRRRLSRGGRGGGKRGELKAGRLTLDRMTINFVGSNSEANLATRPTRYVFCDEVSAPEFMPSAVALVEERTKAWTNRKLMFVSKPGHEGTGIHALYLSSDQRTFEVPCPHCSTYQRLKFAGIRWEGGRDADPDVAEKTAWYECAHCKQHIDNPQRAAMMARGVWVRKGERVRADGCVAGVPENPCRTAGFTFSSLYVVGLPWGYVPKRFLRAGMMTEQIVTGDLGEPWAPVGASAELAELKRLCVPVARGGYALASRLIGHAGANGTAAVRLPPGVVALVGAVDLQRDRAYIEIRAFGERGRDSWLVWYDTRPCSVDSPDSLEILNDLVGMTRASEGARFVDADGIPMRVGAWAIDSGDGMRHREVYAFTAKRPHVYASKGRGGSQIDELYHLAQVDYAAEFAKGISAGKVKLMHVNVDRYKEFVLAQIKRAAGMVDAATDAATVGLRTRLEGKQTSGAGGGGQMHFPADCAEAYLVQLTAEQQVREVAKSGRNQGRPMFVWKMRPGRSDNHFFDTCVYTHALADMLGVERWTVQASRAAREKMAAAEQAPPRAAAATTPAKAKATATATANQSSPGHERWEVV